MIVSAFLEIVISGKGIMLFHKLKELSDSGVKLTPMMEQYYSIKKSYLDIILFFRMGDFYEVFFDDAHKVSKLLNIALTHRGKVCGFPIPMAGIPHHAASSYVDRLTMQGLKVAICEQTQDSKDAVGLVERKVTQIASPGIPFDLNKTEEKEHHYIVSGFQDRKHCYLVALDFTTGEFEGVRLNSVNDFVDRLRLLAPKELITYMGQWENCQEITALIEHYGILPTYLSEEYFSPKNSQIFIGKMIPAYKRDQVINSHKEILSPIGALAYYVCSTQNAKDFVHIHPFKIKNSSNYMKITMPTLEGLEIIPKVREQYRDSLLGYLDNTMTALGSRKLRSVVSNPLNEIKEIRDRQSLIGFFLENSDLLEEIRAELDNVRDLERIMAKVSTNKVIPGDLINIVASINAYEKIRTKLKKMPNNFFDLLLPKELKVLMAISESISSTINDEIGASLEKGNLIKKGCSTRRDKLAKAACGSSDKLSCLEAHYKKSTGIPTLKIKSNNVFGYFIEVSKSHTKKVPDSFDRRQTLTNAERYMTKELGSYEKEIITAKDKLQRIERDLFNQIIEQIQDASKVIIRLSQTIGLIDVFQSLSWVARQEEFTKPVIDEKKKRIDLKGAWHPLIKSSLKDHFVSHDILLDDNIFFGLITGPNMAGKTTVMREVAIIQLLAQIGSYVPATSASVGICDYLFSRLGASDDILKGQSTFMVEMTESAEIIRHATDRSLIILDEVGRGTSTYDGMSIAWALIEYFVHKTKALTLFATHYHELVELTDNLPNAKNLSLETLIDGGEVKFLYRLIEGVSAKSFGIYVAKMAGLPPSIIKRSQELLHDLESKQETAPSPQLNLFEASSEEVKTESISKIEQELCELDIINMTPIEALVSLNKLKQQAEEGVLPE